MNRPLWSSPFYWPPEEIEARQARGRTLFCVSGAVILWGLGLSVGFAVGMGVFAVGLAGLLGIVGSGAGYVLGCGSSIRDMREKLSTYRPDEYRIAQTELIWGSGLVVGAIGGLVAGLLLLMGSSGPVTRLLVVGGMTAAGAVAGGAVIGTIGVIVLRMRWVMLPKTYTVLPGIASTLGMLGLTGIALDAQLHFSEHLPWLSRAAVVVILLVGTPVAGQLGWWTMMFARAMVGILGPYSDRNA